MSCSYKVGKLKNFIYLIKDLKYRVVDYKVYITSGEVYKLDANLVTFAETESYADRFKFTTTVTATLNRIYNDSRIRQSNYKVVVEDTKGQQYIVSPEFNAHFTGEYTINNEGIAYALTFTTQSNIPTRILQSKIIAKEYNEISRPPCEYNGIGIQQLFIGTNNQWKEIDILTAEYQKVYNGSYDQIQITFSYPIEDNDFHYQLISFPQNRWDVKIKTANDEVIEYSLFPQYTRQTAEEGGTDRFTIVMRGVAGSNLKGTTTQQPQYRWVPTEEYICDGFHKYVKEKQEELVNHEWVATGQFRKGTLIETNSEDCGYSIQTLYRWVTLDLTDEYECVGFDKHYKQKQQKSDDNGKTWEDTGVTRAGDIVQVDSADCGYVLTEWKEVEGEYICEEYDPSVTWVLLADEFYCELKPI